MKLAAERPLTFPRRIQTADRRYTARLVWVPDYWTAVWDIVAGPGRSREVIGNIFAQCAYGWRPRYSLTKLVWSGRLPDDCSDSRSTNYGICFDGSPVASYQEAIDGFAKAADRLLKWRSENLKSENPTHKMPAVTASNAHRHRADSPR